MGITTSLQEFESLTFFNFIKYLFIKLSKPNMFLMKLETLLLNV